MSKVFYEGPRDSAYLGHYNPDMSNEEVIFAKGSEIAAGTVMGMVTTTGKYVPFNPDALDGSEIPAGISYANVDVSQSDQRATITVRLCTVKASELIWPEKIDEKKKETAIQILEKNNILLR
ncbi:head decoration protein [Bartonella sp. WD16.2]|uniref:head decoration protein n=1 Tax=Bartonella sp. WD16.2 TaxID=1933904 RepID=UPI00099B06A2|nr:head decoration protein [Bartonella sp. WD16.2]AQX19656.1 Bacteriophage lambda head decoration protein D [Bartonella sp. WD16.2]